MDRIGDKIEETENTLSRINNTQEKINKELKKDCKEIMHAINRRDADEEYVEEKLTGNNKLVDNENKKISKKRKGETTQNSEGREVKDEKEEEEKEWLVVVCLFKQPRLACLVSYCLLFVIYTIICCFGLLCLIHALLLYHCLTTISYLRCVVASAVAVSFFASLMYYSKIFDNSQSVTT